MTVQPFNLIESPLEGINLIEASAGTGKTYTITAIYIRLLLEKMIPVEEILVVTFTEAATAELKERIRSRIRDVLEAFNTGTSFDPFIASIVNTIKDPDKARFTLQIALTAFDQSAIFTIHGFCKRILHDYAFESSSLFDPELVTETRPIVQTVIDDFWRQHFYFASPLLIDYIITQPVKRELFIQPWIKNGFNPYLKIIPDMTGLDLKPDQGATEEHYQALFVDLVKSWQTAKPDIENQLLNDSALNRNKYAVKSIPAWIDQMDQFLSGQEASLLPKDFDKFDKFITATLEQSVKKNASIVIHPFCDLCQAFKETHDHLIESYQTFITRLKRDFLKFMESKLYRIKRKKNICTFDDLIVNLHTALFTEQGKQLAQSVRQKYKAALIDEFQDTDPVQHKILDTIFGQPDHILFLIGDPKQAIYGFRGADIFAYLGASQQATRQYTLSVNYRTWSELIKATNTIFANSGQSFIYPEIAFTPSSSAIDTDSVPEQIQRLGPPFELWLADPTRFDPAGKPIGKTSAAPVIANAVAAEISRLLEPLSSRPDDPTQSIKPKDIAVIVRKNSEAVLVKEALAKYRIPSVLFSTQSLFESPQAEHIEQIMLAMAQPYKTGFIKAAMTNPILGIDGRRLESIIADPDKWEAWCIKFRNYHDLWNRYGFIRMFKTFLNQQDIVNRLTGLENGQRLITNVLHLMEVLHQASVELHLNMFGLLKWIREQRTDQMKLRKEEYQLRLDSDDNAVTIVTIHKSKGLEYPIVFCPFAWDGRFSSQDAVMYHDVQNHMQPVLDLGSQDYKTHETAARVELLSENLRLLYVALTRAKYRCYLVWGRFNDADTSALAYLLHLRQYRDFNSIVDELSRHFKNLPDKDLMADLENLCQKADGRMTVKPLSDEHGIVFENLFQSKIVLKQPTFSGAIDLGFKITSFSDLISNRPGDMFHRDPDEVHVEPDNPAPENDLIVNQPDPLSIYAFPKGTQAGIFVHDLLEQRFKTGQQAISQNDLVLQKLIQYGFDTKWEKTVTDMMLNIENVRLDNGRDHFKLGQIDPKDCLTEMEFYFPVTLRSKTQISKQFAQATGLRIGTDFPQHIERLNFSPIKGFLKGFIDLVFRHNGQYYIIDWKSNYLGDTIDHYHSKALLPVMSESYYILQYYLYTVALSKYLSAKIKDYDYNRDFGGIFYLFLRGIDHAKGPDFGVFYDKPPSDVILGLTQSLTESPPRDDGS